MEDKDLMEFSKSTQYKQTRKLPNIFSYIFFTWELPVFWKSLRKKLCDEDFYRLIETHKSEVLGNKLEKFWEAELNFNKYPSLWRALMKTFLWEFLLYGLIHLASELLTLICAPIFLEKLLTYYAQQHSTISDSEAYVYSFLFVLIIALYVLSVNWLLFGESVLGMKIRIACCSLIYKKSLYLDKNNYYSDITLGQTVNLLSNDLRRFDNGFIFIAFLLWITPAQLVIILCILILKYNYFPLVGVGLLIVCTVFIVCAGKKVSSYRSSIAAKSDYRIQLINGIITGIKIVKMYTWEKPLAQLVQEARKSEIDNIATISHFRISMVSIKGIIHRLNMFLYILVSILSDSEITLQEIFLASILFEIVKVPILGATPIAIVDITEINITIHRIQAVLLCDYNPNCIRYSIQPESIPNNFSKTISSKSINIISSEMKKEVEICAKRVTVKWNPSAANNTLENINFKVRSGELVAFVGPTGSGKSTIFHAILKEIRLLRGVLNVNGTVSYASQEPWIFSASIKQNILFGSEINEEKYCQVIKVCALEHDLSLLPNGDFTVVGERGVMLSGGQKARISLARAVYKEADIYLLDDPLSAVDNNVGKKIFAECITNYLKDKCVLLITHQVQHLKEVKNIYVLEQGKIVAKGNFKQLNNIKLPDDIYQEEVGNDLIEPTKITIGTCKKPAPSINRASVSYGTKNSYQSYLGDDGNWIFTCMIFFLTVCLQIIGGCADYIIIFENDLEHEKNTLMKYTNDINSSDINFSTYDQKARKFLINYSILITVLTVLTVLRSWLFVKLCKRASKNLHNKTFLRIIHGTMKFFNVNHSGEILNRFSRDIGLIDEYLPFILMDVTHSLFSIISTMILISALNIWLVIPMTITIILFCLYGIMFIPIGRNINKLEGGTRNPVCNHLSSSLQGLATIRAFEAQEILINEFNKHQDLHTAVFYKLVAFYNTLRFWVDTTCVLYFALVLFSFFIFKDIPVGYVGLAIVQSTMLKGMSSFFMKNWSDLDNNMAAVGRVQQYVELPTENEDGVQKPPPQWPVQGNLEFHSVSMQYSPKDPFVLNKISFKVKAQQKIGIVGRTGAGKSSVISVLFNLYPFNGTIEIDEMDTKKVPLNILRSKISIVPQEPTLFTETLRKNLDPFNQFSDFEIWKALEEVELKDAVLHLPCGLETIVLDGGANFSVGQKQLLCLVRAILRRNKILVLDEATANIDLKTDELVQSTLRTKFKHCTILTIAHRLHTVIDNDKILVLDSGNVVEFDHPYLLLQNTNGCFYNFVHQNNKEIAENLLNIAKNSYFSKN